MNPIYIVKVKETIKRQNYTRDLVNEFILEGSFFTSKKEANAAFISYKLSQESEFDTKDGRIELCITGETIILTHAERYTN